MIVKSNTKRIIVNISEIPAIIGIFSNMNGIKNIRIIHSTMYAIYFFIIIPPFYKNIIAKHTFFIQ